MDEDEYLSWSSKGRIKVNIGADLYKKMDPKEELLKKPKKLGIFASKDEKNKWQKLQTEIKQ